MDLQTDDAARSDHSRHESIRALACVGGALLLSLAFVAGIRASVGAPSSDGVSRLAVSDVAGAGRSADGHDHQHASDVGGSTGTHDAAAHAAGHDAAAHSHSAGSAAHSHAGGTLTGVHATHDGSGATHDHSTTAGSDIHVHTLASTHTHDSAGSPTASASGGHNHDPSSTSGTTSPTSGHDHSSPAPGGSTTPTTAHQHPPATSAPVQLADLPPDIRAQITAVRDWAMNFPTTQDAIDSGYPQATIFFHGIAAHYLNYSILDDVFDPAVPEALLYNEQGQLVGVNYIVYSGASPPEGFPGDLDQWHEHPTLCRNPTTTLILGAEDVNAADCAAMGGSLFNFSGFYLLHVWCIPGWESPEGIFSHENSRV